MHKSLGLAPAGMSGPRGLQIICTVSAEVICSKVEISIGHHRQQKREVGLPLLGGASSGKKEESRPPILTSLINFSSPACRFSAHLLFV
jgi:hypothetical protein